MAIDIGWRLMPEGLRVGYWVDDAGGEGTVLIPTATLDQFAECEKQRSLLAGHFNECVAALKEQLQHRESLPEWFTKGTESLAQWRSPARLDRLFGKWRDQRFDGDGSMFD